MTSTATEPTTTDAVVTPIAAAPARKHSPSAATKRANAASKPAASKRTASKPAASKPAPKKVAVVKAHSLRAAKQVLGTGCIKVLADYAMKVMVPEGMTRDEVLTVIGGWASYIPGTFDDRMPMITAGGRRSV